MPEWLGEAAVWRARTEWTAADLARLGLPGLPTTERRIREFLLREAGDGLKRPSRGCVGTITVWNRLAFPAALRQAIAKHIDDAMLRYGLVAAQLPSPTTTREARLIDRMPPKLATRAAARADILAAFRTWRAATGRYGWRGQQAFCDLYNSGQVVVTDATREAVHHVCAASITAWEKRAHDGGAAALAGDYKAADSALEREPALATTAEAAIATFPKIRASQLRDILRAKCPTLQVPHLRSVQRWLAAWRARNRRTAAYLENPDAAKGKFMPAFGDAGASARGINARWEIDATPTDLLLADGKRYTIIGLIDVATRRMRLRVAPTSSGIGVGLLLRRALLDFGIPAVVATDNGAEFVGSHIRRVLHDLQIHHDIAPPFSPEKKPFIERAFRTFSHDLIELVPGYVGHDVAERAAIRARRSFAERLMGKVPEVELGATEMELQAFCDRWCVERYEHRVHGTLGVTPFQAAQAQARNVLRLADERALDVLLAPAAAGDGRRTVTKKGLRLEGGTFIAAELALRIGEPVFCRIDPADAGRVYVFDEDGRFICAAVDPERVGIDRQELAAAARRLAAADLARRRQALREAKRQLDPASIVRAVLDQNAADAAKVVALPQPAEMFTTPALEEHGRAARAEDAPAPPPRTEADARAESHLVDLTARLHAKRSAAAGRDDRAEAAARIARGLKCRDVLLAGMTLAAEELDWFRAYEGSSEFRTVLVDRFGIDIRPGRYRPLAPPASPLPEQPSNEA